jgi:hypothetical protein
MLSATKPMQRLCSLFNEKPCWMIEPLAVKLGYSIPSVRRFLKEAGYYSSFTHNGAWYTLQSIPDFGKGDLWFFGDVGFSSFSSLTNTLIGLISRSPAGLTAEELGLKLHCRCHAILVQLCRIGKLGRQKQGHSYIYLASDSQISYSQRQAMASKSLHPNQISAEIAVMVLVEFIKSPTSSLEHLVNVMKNTKGVTVDLAQVERLFETHNLKKTALTVQPKH